MFRQIYTALNRAPVTMAQDAVGVAAIFLILFVGLHLPYLT